MKILYTADWHLRASVPANRKEGISEFMEMQYAKLNEIVDLFNKEADMMIIGGDIFDRYRPEYSILNATIGILKKVEKEIYIVLGNHDIIGANIASVERSGVGALLKAGVLQSLFSYEDNTFSSESHTIRIRGLHYRLDADLEKDYMFDKKYKNTFDIIVDHNMIVPEKDYPFVCIPHKDIKTNADIILCSHWHQPWKGTEGKTKFYNAGCIVRQNITEIGHSPQVLILDIEDNKMSATPKFLKCAKKGNEVFDMESVKEKKEHLQQYGEFIESLKEVKLEDLEVSQLVETLGKEENVDKKVVKEAKDRIEKAEQELK